MNVTGSYPAGGSPPDITLGVAERQIVPGETAYFQFIVHTGQQASSIHDFDVTSDNPNFNPAWAHIVRSADTSSGHYTLEVHPGEIRRSQYGTYPLRLYWGRPGTPRHAEVPCTLIIKPCLRITGKPSLQIWPTGTVSLSLENCGRTGVEVSISVRHHGSSWSRGWEFELQSEEGPFEFSEKFDPPTGTHQGEFELDISAEGVSLIRMRIQAKRLLISRKLIITTTILLVGAAIGITLALAGTKTQLISQSIIFTSAPPASAATGDAYRVAAVGGASGNPVTFIIDPSDTSICSLSGSTVTFNQPGSCVIDANQAGNAKYQPAPQAQQAVTVQPSIPPPTTAPPTTAPPTTAPPTTAPPTTAPPTTAPPTTAPPTTAPPTTAVPVP